MTTRPPQYHSSYKFVQSLAVSTGQTNLQSRPKLLFLAYTFPPVNVTASVRTWNIAKHLAKLGWDVTVVTPKPELWRHTNESEETRAQPEKENIKLIKTGHAWRWLVPGYLITSESKGAQLVGGLCRRVAKAFGIDRCIGWIKEAERACSSLEKSNVDLILASGPPFCIFRLAKKLAAKWARPYVLDYRDPWTGNPHANFKYTIAAESKILVDCAAVTIVSPSWAEAMDGRFRLGDRLHVVSNGYDEEELASVKPHEFGHFAIVCAGTFYPPKRVITPIMAALSQIRDSAHSQATAWYFHYYGSASEHVREMAQRFGVLDRVILHGRVSRSDAWAAVKGAGVAVVITSVYPEGSLEDKGIMTGKIFETMGLRTPVLLIAPRESDARNMLEYTRIGDVFTGEDIAGIVSLLLKRMDGARLHATRCDDYSWKSIGSRFDKILRHAVDLAKENDQYSDCEPWDEQGKEKRVFCISSG